MCAPTIHVDLSRISKLSQWQGFGKKIKWLLIVLLATSKIYTKKMCNDHKTYFSNPYIFATWWHNLLIFHSLNYKRSTASGYNDLGMRKLWFVIIAQLLNSSGKGTYFDCSQNHRYKLPNFMLLLLAFNFGKFQ